jgi:asparagine synthase (glutamine-hydrolysing)
MAVSLEGREPLLDHHIIEWAAQLPSEFKLTNGVSKFLLRKITHKYIPKEIMEREKMGFRIPVEEWLKGEQKDLLTDYVTGKTLKQYGLLNTAGVDKMIDLYIKGNTKVDFNRIWKIFILQIWLDKWVN